MGTKIHYRSFRNQDRHGLVCAWNSSSYVGKWFDAIDDVRFEVNILAKPFFDRRFMVVALEQNEKKPSEDSCETQSTGVANVAGAAEDEILQERPFNRFSDGRVIGFVHGGFRPQSNGIDVDYSVGTVAMLVVEARKDQDEIRKQLLKEIEKRFQEVGAKTIDAGAVYPNAPFYFGVVYGSELCGIPENDPFWPPILQEMNYVQLQRYHRFRIELADCHLPMSFEQVLLRRRFDLVETPNASSGDWWEASTLTTTDWTRFKLVEKLTKNAIAWVGVRKLPPNSEYENRFGLLNLFVREQYRRQRFAQTLLTLVLDQLALRHKDAAAELQIPEGNAHAMNTFIKMNFKKISTGVVFQRDLSPLQDESAPRPEEG